MKRTYYTTCFSGKILLAFTLTQGTHNAYDMIPQQ